MVLSSVPRRQVAEPHYSNPTFPDAQPSLDRSCDRPILSVLNRFFYEWTEPEMILGMGLGHLGWEAGRLLGFKGALALGRGAGQALWAGRAVGIGVEGATWATATQLGRHHGAWGQTWAENTALSATLRSTQAIFGRHGPWGLALGSYVGLVVSQQATAMARSHHALPWTETMSDSAALFASFYAGGTMARFFWGSTLARMEQGLLQKFYQTQAQAEPSLAQGNLVWAISNGNQGSNGPPARRPLSSHPQVREIQAPESGTIKSPKRVENFDKLLGHLQNPKSRFHEKIMENHVYFMLGTNKSYSTTEIGKVLNDLSYLRDIPSGRRVQIQFEDNTSIHHFTKLGPIFRFREGGRITPVENSASSVPPAAPRHEQTTAALAGVRAQMGRVALRRTVSSSKISSSRPPSETLAGAVEIPPPSRPVNPATNPAMPAVAASLSLKVAATPQEMNDFFQALIKNSNEKFFGEVLFNGSRALRPEEILQARKFMEGSIDESRIALHDPHPRRTYFFYSEGGRAIGSSFAWTAPEQFHHLEVQSLIELVQKLSFLRSAPSPVLGPLLIDVGRWRPWQDGFELEKFLNAQVRDPHPALKIRQEKNTQTIYFDPVKGRWVLGDWK